MARHSVATVLVPLVLLALGPSTTRGGISVGNATFPEEELVDSKDVSHPEGGCANDGCLAYCRQRLHASGRCDHNLQCVCRDLKLKSKCARCGCDNCFGLNQVLNALRPPAPGVVIPGASGTESTVKPVVPDTGNPAIPGLGNMASLLGNIINNNNAVVIQGRRTNATALVE